MSERPLFILAGNGPYQNRGCEAIVRGTVSILSQQYNDPQFICISHFNSNEQFEEQRNTEFDPNIRHLSTFRLNKRGAISTFYRSKTMKYIYRSVFKGRKLDYSIYGDMLPHLKEAKAVLSIGGDNYSLDYGIPTLFTMLDNLVLRENKPLIIWGASVGPFNKEPEFEQLMIRHLQEVTGIFARESATIDYLRDIGIAENVHPVSDPAFLMEPSCPNNIEGNFPLDEEAIGINLSPLMANYVTNGNLNAWTDKAASIIENIAKMTNMPVYLIPHVTVPSSNDYMFMKNALARIQNKKNNLFLIPPAFNAAETKWIISKMALFAGSRTHSTIAALSSGIPTLCFAYSIKAQGINRDIFGNTDYCLEPLELNPRTIANRILAMLDEKAAIGNDLMSRMVDIKKSAFSAGMILKHVLEEN